MAVRARTIGNGRTQAELLSELSWALGACGAARTLLIGHRPAPAREPQVLAFSLMPLGAADVLARAETMPPVPSGDALAGTLRAVRAVERMGVEARPVPALEGAAAPPRPPPAGPAPAPAAPPRRSGALGIGLDCEGCIAVAALLRALGEPDP